MAGTVEHASLSGVKSKGLALDSVQLEMLQAAVKDEKVNLGLDEVKAAGIDLQTGKVDLKVPTASAERIQAVLDKARFASASVGALDVPTAQFALHERARNDGEAIPTPMAGTGATPTLNEGSVGGTAGATSGVDIDTATVVRSLGARVDDVDADVRIPFKGGEYGEGLGSVGVKRGTVADLKLGVQDGRIVPDETKLDFNHHLDALLWIRGRGAYLTRDGKVKIDVGGWFDEDVTKDINKSLTGKKSKTIPLSTADLSAAVATKMERSEKEEQLAAAGAPHGTTAAAKKKPSSKDPKDLASAIQLDKLSGSASASFSPGKVELGGGNSFELGDAKNTATVEQQAGQDMVAKFVDFLLQSMSIKVGEHQVSGASASADEVQVRLEKDPSSKVHATGTVQGLRAEDVKVD